MQIALASGERKWFICISRRLNFRSANGLSKPRDELLASYFCYRQTRDGRETSSEFKVCALASSLARNFKVHRFGMRASLRQVLAGQTLQFRSRQFNGSESKRNLRHFLRRDKTWLRRSQIVKAKYLTSAAGVGGTTDH